MAWYVRGTSVSELLITTDAFKPVHAPGQSVPYSGIYKCTGCAREVTSNQGDPFPPQNHHQHTPSQGFILWKLLVMTNVSGI